MACGAGVRGVENALLSLQEDGACRLVLPWLSPTKQQINFSETHKVPVTSRGRVMIDGSACPQLQCVFVLHIKVP